MSKETKEIPKEHQLICDGCKKVLDMRDPSILAHGWIENGIIVCYDEVDIPYSSSQKIGDSIQYDKNKNPIHLN